MEADERIKAVQSSSLSESRVCPACNLSVSMSITRCPNDGTSLLTSSEVGTALAHQYEFISVIASGGMGIVYEARHVVLNQKVAIKMMQSDRLTEKAIRRFKKEAEALAALEHMHIIHVRDYGLTENGQPYIVLEYVEGMSMSQMIQSRGPIPFVFAVEFFIEVAEALAHAHEKGVLHQDLKPNNIMICEPRNQTPYAKLIDFGIAKIIDGESTPAGLTSTGDVLGSPAYMSPEQANGGRVDARTDIYSLGCVMFEALTGTQPFKGATALEVIAHQINTKAPLIEDLSISEFPARLCKIVARCLEKDPNKRFQSMNDLREELLNVIVDASKGAEDDEMVTDSSEKSSSGSILIMCGIALCLVVILANAVILFQESTAQKARQVELKKVAVEARDAGHYDESVLARQYISEELRKWRPGTLFNLKVESYDKDFEEFSHHPANVTAFMLENSGAKGAGLAYLIRYPIDILSLNDSSITDRAFLEITHMKKLNELQVDTVSITDDGLKYLQDLPLRRLSVRLNKLTDAALKNIAKIKSLQHLQCGRNDKLTAAGYEQLQGMPNLLNLDVMENHLPAQALKAISKLKVIVLNLEKTDVDDEGLHQLVGLSSLKDLQLTGCTHVSGAGLKYLAKLPQLDTVNLEATAIGDQDVDELIRKSPSLKYLDLRATKITDKTMELVGNSAIRSLFIQKDNITDRGLASLLKDRNLRRLDLGDNNISQQAKDNFAKLRPGVIRISAEPKRATADDF